MIALRHFFTPEPDTDLRDLGVELVTYDDHGRPERQSVWNALRLLDRAPGPDARRAALR